MEIDKKKKIFPKKYSRDINQESMGNHKEKYQEKSKSKSTMKHHGFYSGSDIDAETFINEFCKFADDDGGGTKKSIKQSM